MNPLQARLAAVRRRLRLVVSFRGLCWLATVLVAATTLAGLLDWWLSLPALVRALALVATLAGTAWVALRSLFGPLLARADDLTLALRVERSHPELTDTLASAVQFLEQSPEDETTSSPALRRQAVRQALEQIRLRDLTRVVDSRGLFSAGCAALASTGLAVVLAVTTPDLARIALLRLAVPFGTYQWPRSTTVAVQYRPRVPRAEPFEMTVQLEGVIPNRATVEYLLDDPLPVEQTHDLRREEKADGTARFVARLEASRVQRDFRFRVRANDGDSGWQAVAVLPPPQLVSLEGRPSPQIHLRYPAYTDLPAQDAPDGTSSLDAVVGTAITLRAASDRPLVRAWLEYPPELTPTLTLAAGLSLPGLVQPAEQWRHLPARLSADGRVLTVEFLARLSGSCVLHFEDENGMTGNRLLDLATLTDPPPAVQLLRPSRTQDSLEILPEAEITLQVLAEDPYFAVRSVFLEYRLRRDGAERVARLPLFDQRLRENFTALAGLAARRLPFPANPLRLRPQRVPLTTRWALRPLGLKEGDTLVLQACADDFDDVTVGKLCGRSHEIELRVVSPLALDLSLNEAQGRIQQELLRLHKQQQEALDKVAGVEAFARNNQGKLQPNHLDELLQAEQQQQQIRARVGDRQEGLRAEVDRVLQALRDNRLPRSGTNDRMETVARELDRLARDHLEQIEPRLTTARKENESNRTRPEAAREALREARGHQEAVQQTLDNLLQLLEPWSSTRELKGEAKSLLQEQRRLNAETANLSRDKRIPSGTRPEALQPEQRSELERTAEAQQKLADRVGQLLSRMERVASERQTRDPATAESLRQAARAGSESNAEGALRQSAQSLRDNQLGQAAGQQREGTQGLEKVVQALEEQREADLDRLVKKLRQAEQKLAELVQRQEELRKQAREAMQLPDAQQREEALRRLAREQERLQQETQEMLRELTRLRADQAGQALSQAAGQMGRAGQQLNQGDNPEAEQDEALDRLNEARQQVQEAREEAEDELTREKLAKIADQLKGLKDRQESGMAEAARLHSEVLREKGWRRPLLSSLRELARFQAGLARETRALAEEKVSEARVFYHLLGKAAGDMERAGELARERLDQAQQTFEAAEGGEPELDPAQEQAANDELQSAQRAAIRRLEQLLDALKPDQGGRRRPLDEDEGEQPGGEGGGGGGQPGGERFPPLAQLKALRALQQDVNARTERFHQQHPEAARLTAKDKAALQALRQEQQEIADLFQHLTAAVEERQGEKK